MKKPVITAAIMAVALLACDACTDYGTGSGCNECPHRSAGSATVDHNGNSRSMASELSLRLLQLFRP
jgi:hypothetical protein